MRKERDDKNYMPELPPIEGAEHLIGYLWEVGPLASGAAAQAPVSFTEIRAWQDLSGIDLMPWEARFLRRLSFDYLTELHQAEKPDCKAPWQPTDYVPDFKAVSKSMRSAIASLAKL